MSNGKLLSWSLRAGSSDYNVDMEKYGNKIYAMGIHEFNVQADGSIEDRRTGIDIHSAYIPQVIEDQMLRWPHIKWYLSMTCFGSSRVIPHLDDTTIQNAFIQNLEDVVAKYKTDRNDSGTSLPIHGIEIDFEASLSDYPERSGDELKYMTVLKRVKEEVCIPNGLKLQVNAYAMWGLNTPYYYRFHDYKVFAESTDSQGDSVIDNLQIMTYDFSWPGSAPGASTPIWWFKDVAEWAKQNFDPTVNSSAKLTIDNVFFGAAGYGNRWGISDPNGLFGKNVTFRNLLGWQNGLYRHYHYDGGLDKYVYHDQEYLLQNGFEDALSKNQVMFQHVYDFGPAKYGSIKKQDGTSTAYPGVYNEKNYITSYQRTQQAQFTGVHEAKISADVLLGKCNTSYTTTKNVDGTDYTFQGYSTSRPIYEPIFDVESGSSSCELEPTPAGKIVYEVSPGAGTHRVLALVSFPWYTQKKLAGSFNPSEVVDPDTLEIIDYTGGSTFTIGGAALPEHYPLMFKASHWFDMGEISFSSGTNTIMIDGANSESGTVILGFVICDSFSHNFIGGEVSHVVNVQPFLKKDKTPAPIPSSLAISTELLRQDSRPCILWEDRFAQYLNDDAVQAYGLTAASIYYRKYKTYSTNGSSYNESSGGCEGSYVDGYSYGDWSVERDENGRACARFDHTLGDSSGQLILNHEFNGNVQIEAEVKLEEGRAVGIRFGSYGPGDGYVFIVDYDTQMVRLELNDPWPNTTIIAEEPLSDTMTRGNTIKMKAIMHNGKGYFYTGYGEKQVFGGAVSLSRSAGGACGIFASQTKTNVYVLSIATTDKWETMEKFEVEVDGTVYPFGQIDRPGYTYDEWGFLNYAGIDERSIRTDPTDVPADYKFNIATVPGFQGAKTVKIRFIDPGLWYANIYVGDSEGCSITYAGDAETFRHLLNVAVNEYGAKGIGLWALGQEDPKAFAALEDVVPWHS